MLHGREQGSNGNNESGDGEPGRHRETENLISNFQFFNNFYGFYALWDEFINLVQRADKRYAESRKYQSSGIIRSENKVAVITGGDKDIGADAAAYLAKTGYKIIIGTNDDQYSSRIGQSFKQNKVKVLKLDLTSIDSVRDFAKQVSLLEPKIDLLINTADHFETEYKLTKDGIETNFQENYLGHFLLTNQLLRNLEKSENGRIINVSSMAHYFGFINFNDINNTGLPPIIAYNQSKLALVLFTRELAKRLLETNVTAYVVSPEIIRQPISIPNSPPWDEILGRMTDPTNGSQTILYVGLEDPLKNESGFYYSNLKRVHPLLWNASDDTAADKLWELSEVLSRMEGPHKHGLRKELGHRIPEMSRSVSDITSKVTSLLDSEIVFETDSEIVSQISSETTLETVSEITSETVSELNVNLNKQ